MSFEHEKDFTEEQILRCRLKWAVANRDQCGFVYHDTHVDKAFCTCRCCGSQAIYSDLIKHDEDCTYADILKRIGAI